MFFPIHSDLSACCGCKACASACKKGAIQFYADEEGFLYPQIDENKCVNCGLCEQICPQNIRVKETNLLETYAAINKDDAVLVKSSSGGLFSAFAKAVFENGGVVYGVAYDKEQRAKFIRAENINEFEPLRGSKYVQADPQDVYSNALCDVKQGRIVLFSGTPCQVAAFRNMLNPNSDNVLLIDIICHGVTSPKLFNDFVRFCEKKNKSKIVHYANRSKAKGWMHLEEQTYQSGRTDCKSLLSQAWRNIFYSSYAMRPSCYSCNFNLYSQNRVADITLADFWGIENFYPDFYNKFGVSFVGIYTPQGEKWMRKILDDIEYIPVSIDHVITRQPHYRGESVKVSTDKREEFWNIFQQRGISAIVKLYGKCNFKELLKKRIKSTYLYRLIRG